MRYRVYVLTNDGQKEIVEANLGFAQAQRLIGSIQQDIINGKRGTPEGLNMEPMPPTLTQKQLLDCHNNMVAAGKPGISFKPNKAAVKPCHTTPLFEPLNPSRDHEQQNLF